MQNIRIAVIGDFDPSNLTHTMTATSLLHANDSIAAVWIGTDVVAHAPLDAYDGVWCATASPYVSMEGALEGIRFARERGVPFFGTCAGFQHAVIEYARGVGGFPGATSAEYGVTESPLIVTRLVCSLAGKRLRINVAPGSRAHQLYGSEAVDEQYYCNFGFNEEYRERLESSGLRFTGRSDDGEARIMEIPIHPFFLATLFVPQTASLPGQPHPLVAGFAEAARKFHMNRCSDDAAAASTTG